MPRKKLDDLDATVSIPASTEPVSKKVKLA